MNWLSAQEGRMLQSYAQPISNLALFRVMYALFIFITVIPVAAWLPLAPRIFFYPPISLAALFNSPASAHLLFALNLLLTLFAALLLVGWKTRLASFGTGMTLLLLNSFAYSLGKINHDILLVITPLLFAFSGWGRALSLDARDQKISANETGGSESIGTDSAETWPLAILALLIGFAMFTSAWTKATTGWLNPQLHCTYGHLVTNMLVTGRETWLAQWALRVDSPWLWKLADWSAVLIEFAFLPAVFDRRWFCRVLALATLFHLGVLLLFDIPFGVNILIYAAFVPFEKLPLLRVLNNAAPPRVGVLRALFSFALVVGVTASWLGKSLDKVCAFSLDKALVWAGVTVSLWFLWLTIQTILWRRTWHRSDSEPRER